MAHVTISVERVGADKWTAEVVGVRGGRHLANREAAATLDEVLAWVKTSVGEVDAAPVKTPTDPPVADRTAPRSKRGAQ